MIELRFHEELYDGFAIDFAVKTYAPYATFELVKEAGGFVVKVYEKPEEEGGAEVSLVAMELMNFALGKTIERSRTSEAATAAVSAPDGDAAAPDLAPTDAAAPVAPTDAAHAEAPDLAPTDATHASATTHPAKEAS